jgi:hypothetical protein
MEIEVDELIAESLKESILMHRDFSFDEFETEHNKARLLSSLYDVLRYYTTHEEYKDFLEEIQNAD